MESLSTNQVKMRLLIGACAAAMASASGAQAYAQSSVQQPPSDRGATADSKPEVGLGEIIVTARRVQESLQSVPASIGTLDAGQLEVRQITSLNSIANNVVGLTITDTPSPGGGYYTIRGITASSLPTPALDVSTGFYVDGVYIARSQGQNFNQADIARVEVLRGPQGTLIGRNSAAGAISFVTNVPTMDRMLRMEVEAGNYGHKRGTVVVNQPIGRDLAVRVSYLHDDIDGNVRNSTSLPGLTYSGLRSFRAPSRWGGSNSDAVSARVRYTGIDGLTVDYKYDYSNRHEVAIPSQLLGFIPDARAGGLNALLASLYPIQTPGTVPVSTKRLSAVPGGDTTGSIIKSSGHLINAEYALTDEVTLKNITAWRRLEAFTAQDNDSGDWSIPFFNTQVTILSSYNDQRQNQFSQENQVIGKFGALRVLAGAYYFVEHADFTFYFNNLQLVPRMPAVYTPATSPFVSSPLFGIVPGPLALGELASYRNRSLAGYAHVDYDFNDVFSISLGGRYTSDKRRTNDLRSFGSGLQRYKDNRFTYDATLNAQVDSTKLLYARYATGYTSGGISGNLPFKPEKMRQAEVGFKTEWLDRRLRVNGSAYYTWLRDQQRSVVSVNPAANPVLAGLGVAPPYPLGLILFNITGQTTFKGFELETVFVPTRGLTLSGNIGYNDPKFADGSKQLGPKTQLSFSTDYRVMEFGESSSVNLHFDGNYRSKYFGSGYNVPGFFTGAVDPALLQGFATSAQYNEYVRKGSEIGDYWLFNGRVTVADLNIGGAKAKISGYVNNIFDKRGLVYALNVGIGISGGFERPRTYGASVGFQF